MPRRKQEAPKRAAAYSPKELTDHTVEDEEVEADDLPSAPQDDLSMKDEFVEQNTVPAKEQSCDQESAGAVELSGQEMDSESHVSETSDRLSDFESPSRKAEGNLVTGTLNGGTKTPPICMDTLEQMKAIYSSFLTSPLWSPLNYNSTPPQAQSSASTEKPSRSNSTSSSSSCSSSSYDWHQSAVAKTLQQHPPQSRHPAPSEPSLFSTVQLHRQNPKLFGSIFTGASKFRCKGCSAAYDTLVELTVHMNDTGHYRDDNQDRAGGGAKRWSKPRKRSLLEMEGKEDAQKVLKCMYCGHSFESLQDLSVHMIKTKHYQKVPLKEPMAPVATKIMSAKKRGLAGLDLSSYPRSREGTPKAKHLQADLSEPSQKPSSSPYTTPNNRYGHQNGASYAWQFESNKFQILKCMECGSSHNTLQELRTHMMVTGHFLRVTSSVGKRIKTLPEATSPNPGRVTTPTEQRVQSVPLAPSTFSPPPLQTTTTPPSTSPPLKEIKKEEVEEECTKQEAVGNEKQVAVSVEGEEDDEEEKYDISKYTYLTEEDLKESPKGGLDILKSLENTVTSAINKAQSGNPSWGGYPSIHAAYQFPSALKLQQGSMEKNSPMKFLYNGVDGALCSLPKNQPLISPPLSQSSPFPTNNFQAMEDLVKKVTEKVAKVEQSVKQLSPKRENHLSPCSSEAGESHRGGEADSPREWRAVTPANSDRGSHSDRASPATEPKRETAVKSPLASTLRCSTAIITGHTPLEQPFVNPLSALQSVMNVHLGKAAKPSLPNQDPLSLLSRLSQNMAERAAVAAPPSQTKKIESVVDNNFCQPSDDQPMDLTKGKSERGGSLGSAPLTPSSTASSISPSSLVSPAKLTVVSPYTSSSPLHENALSDISDMLRNLTQSHHVPKPATRSRVTDKAEVVGSTHEDDDTSLYSHKRKGRHSNWNPQHLLLLQAQFASSLRQTSEGKYIIHDLSPQERMHISRFTGLSMTTISHWLANVKYQLRRTGRTKFLKNLDSGQPIFFCSDCASQIRTPAAYVCHLEAHLGFRIRDLAKLSPKQTVRDSHTLTEKLVPLESLLSPQDDCSSNGAVYRCQLCVRKFATKHAIKLHLSKSHGKSPEDHLLYVCELDKH
ncbi:teashirt homolog 3 isoform X1 [Anabas testudineus]|uniref:C2H2-type domain-containing protein n=2 Tax=Anabas testudineus TaxID=64144 RepID=A0AAQ6IQD9_ANATE|nr:teashirt homolog 3 isoform X1 [Anabas testudineus]